MDSRKNTINNYQLTTTLHYIPPFITKITIVKHSSLITSNDLMWFSYKFRIVRLDKAVVLYLEILSTWIFSLNSAALHHIASRHGTMRHNTTQKHTKAHKSIGYEDIAERLNWYWLYKTMSWCRWWWGWWGWWRWWGWLWWRCADNNLFDNFKSWRSSFSSSKISGIFLKSFFINILQTRRWERQDTWLSSFTIAYISRMRGVAWCVMRGWDECSVNKKV